MATLFYLNEVVKFAVEKEQQSTQLYQTLAKMTQNPDEKAFFEQMVVEEQAHESFYAALLELVQDEQTPVVKEDDEYAVYMRALIASSRTVEEPKLDLQSMNLNTILDYAIAREKDSVLFYVGLKEYVPQKSRDHIDLIIREEVRHVSLLVGMKKAELS